MIFVLGISSFLYFRYVVPYHICFKEQIQLFVYSSSSFLSYFSKPAFLVCLGGDFLTQFFYFKGGGAAVASLLLIAEWRLIFLILKRFSVKKPHDMSLLLWSLIPVMIEWIYFASVAFFVSFSVSFIIAMAVFLFYAQTSGKISVAAGILLILPLYLMAGASVFLFVAITVLYEIYHGKKRFIYCTAIIGLSLIIPLLLRLHFLLTLKQACFYPFPDVRQGLTLLTLIFILMVMMIAYEYHFRVKFGYIFSTIILTSIWITGLVKTTDLKQENLFGITIEACQNHWDKVLEIAEKNELKNPVATQYVNIALSQKGIIGERFLEFYQPFSSGLFLPVKPSSNWFVIFSANDAYFHIGDMDMAQHAAMVGMISTPLQRSARLTERLAEINLSTGDIPVATKYIRVLESTLFHKIKTDNKNTNVPHRGIFQQNVIRKSDDIRSSLELLVEGDPDNLPAVNYLLCYYLLNKNITAFFKAYTSFCKEKIINVPKVYAQALLIYFAGTNSAINEVISYGIHPDIITSFSEYTRLYEKSEGNLLPMQEKFPDTYWLFYHFAVMKD